MFISASAVKDLIERISSQIKPHGLAPLPAADYQALATCDKHLFEGLLGRGMVVIAPRGHVGNKVTLRRTPLGSLPLNIISVLGVEEAIYQWVIDNLAPYCGRCGIVATPPGSIERLELPNESGVVAISVIEKDQQFSLKESCEWLGSERAVINDRLVSVAELGEADNGEPIVAMVASATQATLDQELSKWFARGGGEVRLIHFKSRDAIGVELAKIIGNWSCPKCAERFSKPSRIEIEAAIACSTCKGDGWLLVEDGRHRACRDCDGYGSNAPIALYLCGETALKDLATLSLLELSTMGSSRFPPDLSDRLNIIIGCGLGDYPLGAAVELFSRGELALLSIAAAELSGFSDSKYLVDRAVGNLSLGAAQKSVFLRGKVLIATPESDSGHRLLGTPQLKTSSGREIVIRDLHRGVLNLKEISFPIGGVSSVSGAAGSGKSLLLKIIAERFQKRRKFEHLAAFGDLKRCELISPEMNDEKTVLEALGFAKPLAGEIAKTRRAQELGLLEEDLELPRSSYRCRVCDESSAGDEMIHGGVVSDSCSSCSGALYDWRIAELPFGRGTVSNIMTTQLKALDSLPWIDQAIIELGCIVPHELEQVTLNTKVAQLSRPDQRLVALLGGFLRVFGRSERIRGVNSLGRELVLIDGPPVLPDTHLGVIARLLGRLNSQGATVVYADMPETLESICSCVLELSQAREPRVARAEAVYLDQRYARGIDR
jgi:hypothetical protein